MSQTLNLRHEMRRSNQQGWILNNSGNEQNGYSNEGYVGGKNHFPKSYYWYEQKGKGWIDCSWRGQNNQPSAFEWRMNTPYCDQDESSNPGSSSLTSLANMCAEIRVAKNKNSSLSNSYFNTFQLNQTLSTSTKNVSSECRKFGLFRDPHKKVDWDGLVDDIFTDEINKLADQVRNNISYGIDFK